jgi:hypothetical protein
MYIKFYSKKTEQATWEDNIKMDVKEIGCEGVR